MALKRKSGKTVGPDEIPVEVWWGLGEVAVFDEVIQQALMLRKSTADAVFALTKIIDKRRAGQRELHCFIVDLKKANGRVWR